MIMPAVQKPHWNPCASRNARCIGCSVVAAGQALDGRHLAAFGAERRHQAAMHRLAVEIDRAGATVAGVAPLLDAEPAELAQISAQALPGRRRCREFLAVDLYAHLGAHGAAPAPSSRRISSAKCRLMCRRHAGRAVHVVVPAIRRNCLFDACAQAVRIRQGLKGKLYRPRGRRRDGQREFAVARQRADHNCAGASQWRQRNLPEGGAAGQRVGGEGDAAQQLARQQDVIERPAHEIGHRHLPLSPVRRPQRAHAVERRGQRNHRSRRQRHAQVAADGRRVPDLERGEERAGTLADQRRGGPAWRRAQGIELRDRAGGGDLQPVVAHGQRRPVQGPEIDQPRQRGLRL